MAWTVDIGNKASKQAAKLPAKVRDTLKALMQEIAKTGPVRGDWRNYSTLANGDHHCNLKKGRPTYVAVWQVTDRTIRIVEVIYVGTHEKAPY